MMADTMARAVQRAAGLVLVGWCADAISASLACASSTPDVGVLDLGLYCNDAALAVTTFGAGATLARVLLVTANLDVEQLARALIAGAVNCISATVDRRTFVRSVQATARGESLIPPRLQTAVLTRVVELKRATNDELSLREIEVLRLAAKGLTVHDIANALLVSANTVHTYLHRAYRKLEANNRSGAVAAAIRRGIV